LETGDTEMAWEKAVRHNNIRRILHGAVVTEANETDGRWYFWLSAQLYAKYQYRYTGKSIRPGEARE